MPARPKVLVVGWGAADWKFITPLLEAGQLPALERLLARGVMGDLAGPVPAVPALLWTSLATGVRADRHGVLGPDEPDPATGGVRPTASTSRRVKAVWNVLSQSGLRTHVVNWPATHPAEPVSGVCVSDAYPKAAGRPDDPWPLPPGAVQPERLVAELADLRVHPGDLSLTHLQPFVPRAAEVDQDRDRRLVAVAAAVAEATTAHAAATRVLEHEPWDFLAVYYDTIDRLGRTFLSYHPPRQVGVPERDFDLYRGVIDQAYRFHDLMLARLLQLAGPDATVLLVSACGRNPAGGYRSPGVVCLAGDGVRADELIHGAGILDVMPTVLMLFGLPVGADMEGRPLTAAFVSPPEPAHVPSWEAVPGPSGRPAAEPADTPPEVDEALRQLQALGYAEPSGEAQRCRRDQTFTLARVLLDAGRPAEAVPSLEGLVAEQPGEPAYVLLLTQCYLALGRADDARRLAETAAAVVTDPATGETVRALIALAEGRGADALAGFLRAEQAAGPQPELRCHIGFTYLLIGRWAAAERAFRRTLEADAGNPRACYGLAVACLRQDRPEEAAAAALDAVALRHNVPDAHFILGVALARLGRAARAIRALEMALHLQPTSGAAHAWLAAVHEQATGDWGRAADHRRRAAELGAADRAAPAPAAAYTC